MTARLAEPCTLDIRQREVVEAIILQPGVGSWRRSDGLDILQVIIREDQAGDVVLSEKDRCFFNFLRKIVCGEFTNRSLHEFLRFEEVAMR